MDLINFQNGYEIFEVEDMVKLNKLRIDLVKEIKKIFKINEDNPEKVLNKLHQFIKEISADNLNKKRIELIKKINRNNKISNLIFELFRKKIINLFGQDILIQKNILILILWWTKHILNNT